VNSPKCVTPPCCVKRILIQEGDPKIYLVTIVGYENYEVRMRSGDLTSRSRFSNLVLEEIGQIIAPPTHEELNQLLADAERILPYGTSYRGKKAP
jgi:hypothetical protein